MLRHCEERIDGGCCKTIKFHGQQPQLIHNITGRYKRNREKYLKIFNERGMNQNLQKKP